MVKFDQMVISGAQLALLYVLLSKFVSLVFNHCQVTLCYAMSMFCQNQMRNSVDLVGPCLESDQEQKNQVNVVGPCSAI